MTEEAVPYRICPPRYSTELEALRALANAVERMQACLRCGGEGTRRVVGHFMPRFERCDCRRRVDVVMEEVVAWPR